jgi:zinc transporter ZupT
VIVDAVPAAVEPEVAKGGRAAPLIPLAAGVFVGVVIFDALPMSLGAVAGWAWLWAGLGFALMIGSSRLAKGRGPVWAARAAGVGVALHAVLEGVAAGAGLKVGAGGGILLVTGLIKHLVPESVALYAVFTRAGLSPAHAAIRCAGNWVIVAAGFAGSQLWLADAGASARPLGIAMGVATGCFAFMAWVLWKQRNRSAGYGWMGALLGLAWVAVTHL